ncbi:hypothetical protein PspLS_11561 [Pyricularia sp. CBS 133598]|nr:hypothetical protein PspLS_11561 [Pyricularia sp. CBS 133598]
MRFNKILSLLIVGFSITSALPLEPTIQSLDENKSKLTRRARSSGSRSPSPAPAPRVPTPPSRAGTPSGGGALYVEMGETAYLDPTGQNYMVLATAEGPRRRPGVIDDVTNNKERPRTHGIYTDKLASCVAVVITTQGAGTVFAHVPGYISQYLAKRALIHPSKKDQLAALESAMDPAKLVELAALREAARAVMERLHKKAKEIAKKDPRSPAADPRKWIALTVYGPQGDLSGKEIPEVMKQLFGLGGAKCVNCRPAGPFPMTELDRTVRVDLTAQTPAFYVDGRLTPIV